MAAEQRSTVGQLPHTAVLHPDGGVPRPCQNGRKTADTSRHPRAARMASDLSTRRLTPAPTNFQQAVAYTRLVSPVQHRALSAELSRSLGQAAPLRGAGPRRQRRPLPWRGPAGARRAAPADSADQSGSHLTQIGAAGVVFLAPHPLAPAHRV